MKKVNMFALVSLLSVGFIFAADYSVSKRSSDLTKNPAVNGQILQTDGTYNKWSTISNVIGIGSSVQAYDADLDTWATVTPSANGQTLVALANYATMRTNLSLVIGVNVQAYDADLTTWAGITPSANAQALLLLNYATMRTNLNLVIGTDVQAWDAQLDTWSGVTPSTDGQALVSAANYATMRTNLDLEIGIDVQAYDAQLDTWATVTPSDDGKALVAVNYDTMKTNLDLEIGTDVQAYDAGLDKLALDDGGSLTNLETGTLVSKAGAFNRIVITGITTNGTGPLTNVITLQCQDYAGNEITDIGTPNYISVKARYWFSDSVLAAPACTNITSITTHNIKLFTDATGSNSVAEAYLAKNYQDANPITITIVQDTVQFMDFNLECGSGITRNIPLTRP